MMSITGLLIVVLIFLILLYLYLVLKDVPENFPPGPPKLPLWGSYWFLLKEHYNHPHLALEKLSKRYKTDILGLYLGNTPTVVTFSHDLCKELLTREEFTGRNDTIVIRTRGMGELKGIFFIDGSFWKDQRRFSLRHLRDFGFGRRSQCVESFIEDEIKDLLHFLTHEPSKQDLDICKRKGHVLMPDFLYGLLLNAILMILTSSRFDNFELRQLARKVYDFLKNGDATGNALSMTPWLRHFAPSFFGYNTVVETHNYFFSFLKKIIDDHIQTFSNDHHRDFIDDFIGKKLNHEVGCDYNQLLLTVLDFMFPAPAAIGHTLQFYFALLINNPQVQCKVQEELDQIVGNSRLPHLDDRKNLPYTEASLREGIRFIPGNPLGIPRRCMQDTTLAGYFIPKDTIMLPCVWTGHRDARIWKNPNEFMPERFLDQDGKLLKRDNTMGFGAGKRLCAGETFARNTMFLIITAILQNFTIKSPDGKPIDLNNIVPGILLTLNDNWIVFSPRNST